LIIKPEPAPIGAGSYKQGYTMNDYTAHGYASRNIIKFTFEKVVLNGVNGWLATKTMDGVFYGTLFGKTKKTAVSAFNFSDDYEQS
jgi:hypothetical protein